MAIQGCFVNTTIIERNSIRSVSFAFLLLKPDLVLHPQSIVVDNGQLQTLPSMSRQQISLIPTSTPDLPAQAFTHAVSYTFTGSRRWQCCRREYPACCKVRTCILDRDMQGCRTLATPISMSIILASKQMAISMHGNSSLGMTAIHNVATASYQGTSTKLPLAEQQEQAAGNKWWFISNLLVGSQI